MSGPFDPASPSDVARLVQAQPFGWLVTGSGADVRATALPLRPVLDAQGAVVRLQSHLPRSNPQVEVLKRDGRALVLLLGPNGYISPSWIGDRTWGPTWNFASAQFLVEVDLVDDPAALAAHLDDLVGAMEAGRPRAWSVAEMGERYAKLASRIIALDARVLETRARFKLGQDERDEVFAQILGGLEGEGADDLQAWMQDYGRPGR